MIFPRLLARLRRERKASLIGEAIWQQALARLPFLGRLTFEEQSRLRQLSEEFLREKEFSGAGGLLLDDEICASIAIQGCLPVLHLGLACYRDWVGVIVYPHEFIIPRSVEDEFGIVHEYDDIASGEAWEGGPLLISWQDAQMAGTGYNVVIHEFAHKLDMLNGEVDGIPALPRSMPRQQWESTLQAAYDDFCLRVDEACAQEDETVFDPYAAESPGEFFAVMSEAFFETPESLRMDYPALYEQFSRFYRQDPASRPLAC